MEYSRLIKERYSVRDFEQSEVENEKLDIILEAARIAPTAKNMQPQRLYVLRSTEAIKKLDLCTSCRYGAKLAVLVCYDREVNYKRGSDHADMGQVDAAIICTQMMLEAANQGLGTVWVGAFDPVAVIREFDLPENIVPVAILPIGYPAATSEPSERHEDRYEMDHTVRYL